MDKYTRGRFSLKVDRSIASENVINTLRAFCDARCAPAQYPASLAQAGGCWRAVHRAGRPLGNRLRKDLPRVLTAVENGGAGWSKGAAPGLG